MLALVGGKRPTDPDACGRFVSTPDGHVAFDRLVTTMVSTITGTRRGAASAAETLALSGAYSAAEILECLPAVELALAATSPFDQGIE